MPRSFDIYGNLRVDSKRAERQVRRFIKKAESKKINLSINDRKFTQPLGRITGAASEFNKSLAASNARVIAFGASAGILYGMTSAFTSMVKATVRVEKSLADINVILNATKKNLHKFGDSLFKIAGKTGQAFEEVADAAVEFSRQGLGMVDTLKRTENAMILMRLSGMNAQEAVSSLTAAMNSFQSVTLTTTQIINKMAKVDAAFAVSTNDLAKAISRVGSSAEDAGVDFDKLMAAVTSLQQTTARGGAVIGNSLKTIFTRVRRTAVIEQLRELGIASKTAAGDMRPAMSILKDYAKIFDTLSSAEKAHMTELMGGVFQMNQLRALLKDLKKGYSLYDAALQHSTSATNEAVKRNKELNKTLSALMNESLQNLTKMGVALGEFTIAPALRSIMKEFNAMFSGGDAGPFSHGKQLGIAIAPEANWKAVEEVSEDIGKGMMKGIGRFLEGPGVLILGAVFIKLLGNLALFGLKSGKQLMSTWSALGAKTKEHAALQEQIGAALAENPKLLAKVYSGELKIVDAEKQILLLLKQQNAERERLRMLTASMTTNLGKAGAYVAQDKAAGTATLAAGPNMGQRARTPYGFRLRAGGFVPSPDEKISEMHNAALGGYKVKPSEVKKGKLPGISRPVVYNEREQISNIAGKSMISPPSGTIAAKGHRQEAERKLGINPYAGEGFVPNFFPRPNLRTAAGKRQAKGRRGVDFRTVPKVLIDAMQGHSGPFQVRYKSRGGYGKKSEIKTTSGVHLRESDYKPSGKGFPGGGSAKQDHKLMMMMTEKGPRGIPMEGIQAWRPTGQRKWNRRAALGIIPNFATTRIPGRGGTTPMGANAISTYEKHLGLGGGAVNLEEFRLALQAQTNMLGHTNVGNTMRAADVRIDRAVKAGHITSGDAATLKGEIKTLQSRGVTGTHVKREQAKKDTAAEKIKKTIGTNYWMLTSQQGQAKQNTSSGHAGINFGYNLAGWKAQGKGKDFKSLLGKHLDPAFSKMYKGMFGGLGIGDKAPKIESLSQYSGVESLSGTLFDGMVKDAIVRSTGAKNDVTKSLLDIANVNNPAVKKLFDVKGVKAGQSGDLKLKAAGAGAQFSAQLYDDLRVSDKSGKLAGRLAGGMPPTSVTAARKLLKTAGKEITARKKKAAATAAGGYVPNFVPLTGRMMKFMGEGKYGQFFNTGKKLGNTALGLKKFKNTRGPGSRHSLEVMGIAEHKMGKALQGINAPGIAHAKTYGTSEGVMKRGGVLKEIMTGVSPSGIQSLAQAFMRRSYSQSSLGSKGIQANDLSTTGNYFVSPAFKAAAEKIMASIKSNPKMMYDLAGAKGGAGNFKFWEKVLSGGAYNSLLKAGGPSGIKVVDYGNYTQSSRAIAAAQGHVPNFSPLGKAFQREQAATGLPSSEIYSTNVAGLGKVVGNTRDEPTRGALMKNIKSHPNPSMAGMADGHVPNFARRIDPRLAGPYGMKKGLSLSSVAPSPLNMGINPKHLALSAPHLNPSYVPGATGLHMPKPTAGFYGPSGQAAYKTQRPQAGVATGSWTSSAMVSQAMMKSKPMQLQKREVGPRGGVGWAASTAPAIKSITELQSHIKAMGTVGTGAAKHTSQLSSALKVHVKQFREGHAHLEHTLLKGVSAAKNFSEPVRVLQGRLVEAGKFAGVAARDLTALQNRIFAAGQAAKQSAAKWAMGGVPVHGGKAGTSAAGTPIPVNPANAAMRGQINAAMQSKVPMGGPVQNMAAWQNKQMAGMGAGAATQLQKFGMMPKYGGSGLMMGNAMGDQMGKNVALTNQQLRMVNAHVAGMEKSFRQGGTFTSKMAVQLGGLMNKFQIEDSAQQQIVKHIQQRQATYKQIAKAEMDKLMAIKKQTAAINAITARQKPGGAGYVPMNPLAPQRGTGAANRAGAFNKGTYSNAARNPAAGPFGGGTRSSVSGAIDRAQFKQLGTAGMPVVSAAAHKATAQQMAGSAQKFTTAKHVFDPRSTMTHQQLQKGFGASMAAPLAKGANPMMLQGGLMARSATEQVKHLQLGNAQLAKINAEFTAIQGAMAKGVPLSNEITFAFQRVLQKMGLEESIQLEIITAMRGQASAVSAKYANTLESVMIQEQEQAANRKAAADAKKEAVIQTQLNRIQELQVISEMGIGDSLKRRWALLKKGEMMAAVGGTGVTAGLAGFAQKGGQVGHAAIAAQGQIKSAGSQRMMMGAMTFSMLAPMISSTIAQFEKNKTKKAKWEGAGDVAMYGGMGAFFGGKGIAAGVALGAGMGVAKVFRAMIDTSEGLNKKFEIANEEMTNFNDGIAKLTSATERLDQGLLEPDIDPDELMRRKSLQAQAFEKIPTKWRNDIMAASGDKDMLLTVTQQIQANTAKLVHFAEMRKDIAKMQEETRGAWQTMSKGEGAAGFIKNMTGSKTVIGGIFKEVLIGASLAALASTGVGAAPAAAIGAARWGRVALKGDKVRKAMKARKIGATNFMKGAAKKRGMTGYGVAESAKKGLGASRVLAGTGAALGYGMYSGVGRTTGPDGEPDEFRQLVGAMLGANSKENLEKVRELAKKYQGEMFTDDETGDIRLEAITRDFTQHLDMINWFKDKSLTEIAKFEKKAESVKPGDWKGLVSIFEDMGLDENGLKVMEKFFQGREGGKGFADIGKLMNELMVIFPEGKKMKIQLEAYQRIIKSNQEARDRLIKVERQISDSIRSIGIAIERELNSIVSTITTRDKLMNRFNQGRRGHALGFVKGQAKLNEPFTTQTTQASLGFQAAKAENDMKMVNAFQKQYAGGRANILGSLQKDLQGFFNKLSKVYREQEYKNESPTQRKTEIGKITKQRDTLVKLFDKVSRAFAQDEMAGPEQIIPLLESLLLDPVFKGNQQILEGIISSVHLEGNKNQAKLEELIMENRLQRETLKLQYDIQKEQIALEKRLGAFGGVDRFKSGEGEDTIGLMKRWFVSQRIGTGSVNKMSRTGRGDLVMGPQNEEGDIYQGRVALETLHMMKRNMGGGNMSDYIRSGSNEGSLMSPIIQSAIQGREAMMRKDTRGMNEALNMYFGPKGKEGIPSSMLPGGIDIGRMMPEGTSLKQIATEQIAADLEIEDIAGNIHGIKQGIDILNRLNQFEMQQFEDKNKTAFKQAMQEIHLVEAIEGTTDEVGQHARFEGTKLDVIIDLLEAQRAYSEVEKQIRRITNRLTTNNAGRETTNADLVTTTEKRDKLVTGSPLKLTVSEQLVEDAKALMPYGRQNLTSNAELKGEETGKEALARLLKEKKITGWTQWNAGGKPESDFANTGGAGGGSALSDVFASTATDMNSIIWKLGYLLDSKQKEKDLYFGAGVDKDSKFNPKTYNFDLDSQGIKKGDKIPAADRKKIAARQLAKGDKAIAQVETYLEAWATNKEFLRGKYSDKERMQVPGEKNSKFTPGIQIIVSGKAVQSKDVKGRYSLIDKNTDEDYAKWEKMERESQKKQLRFSRAGWSKQLYKNPSDRMIKKNGKEKNFAGGGGEWMKLHADKIITAFSELEKESKPLDAQILRLTATMGDLDAAALVLESELKALDSKLLSLPTPNQIRANWSDKDKRANAEFESAKGNRRKRAAALHDLNLERKNKSQTHRNISRGLIAGKDFDLSQILSGKPGMASGLKMMGADPVKSALERADLAEIKRIMGEDLILTRQETEATKELYHHLMSKRSASESKIKAADDELTRLGTEYEEKKAWNEKAGGYDEYLKWLKVDIVTQLKVIKTEEALISGLKAVTDSLAVNMGAGKTQAMSPLAGMAFGQMALQKSRGGKGEYEKWVKSEKSNRANFILNKSDITGKSAKEKREAIERGAKWDAEDAKVEAASEAAFNAKWASFQPVEGLHGTPEEKAEARKEIARRNQARADAEQAFQDQKLVSSTVQASIKGPRATAEQRAAHEARLANDPQYKAINEFGKLDPKTVTPKMIAKSIDKFEETANEAKLGEIKATYDIIREQTYVFGEEIAAAADLLTQNNIKFKKYGMKDFMRSMRAELTKTPQDFHMAIDKLGKSVVNRFRTGLADTFYQALDGTKKLKDGFKDLFDEINNMITKTLIQMAVDKYIFAPAGLQAPRNNAKGGFVGYASGGPVTGGSGVKDDIPAMLSSGEYVIKKSSVSKYGLGFFDDLNNNGVPQLISGGLAYDKAAKAMSNTKEPSGMLKRSEGSSPDPQAGLSSIRRTGSRSTRSTLRNAYVYDDDNYASMEGSGFEIDSRLSRSSLTDELNPQNEFRSRKQGTLYEYNQQVEQQIKNYKQAIQDWKDAKKARRKKAWTNAAISMVMGLGEEEPMFSSNIKQNYGYKLGKGILGAPGRILGGARDAGVGAWNAGKAGWRRINPPNQGPGGHPLNDGEPNAEGGFSQDNVPALLMGGEYVISKQAVAKHGRSFFDKLNSGALPAFAEGGYVGENASSPESVGRNEISNKIDITVNVGKDEGSGETTESQYDDNREDGNNLGTIIKDVVVKTIIEQTRQGGVLSSVRSFQK